MSALILTVHVLVCIILIIAVLLQSGKAADLAGAFGGMGSQTVFGPRGAATLLSKVTTICAVLFMVTSMGLWILSTKGEKSVVSGEEAPAEKPAVTETQKKQAPENPAAEAEEQKSQASKKEDAQKKKTEPSEKK